MCSSDLPDRVRLHRAGGAGDAQGGGQSGRRELLLASLHGPDPHRSICTPTRSCRGAPVPKTGPPITNWDGANTSSVAFSTRA